MPTKPSRDRGFALVLVLMAIAIGTIIGTWFLAGTSTRLAGAVNLRDATRARYLAEAGLEHSFHLLQYDADVVYDSSASHEAGPFHADSSADTYGFYLDSYGPTTDILNLTGVGHCQGMQVRTSVTVQCVTRYRELLLTHSPVAYWRLGDTAGLVARDEMGAHHGTYTNGVGLDRGGALNGTSNGAAEFDGYDDYVQTGTWSVNNHQLTVMAWFRPEDFDCPDARILCKASGTADADQDWTLTTANVGGQMRLCFYLATHPDGVTKLVASKGVVRAKEWTFVVATYDKSNMVLYQNGEEVGRVAKSHNLKADSTPVWIGGNPYNARSKPFHGRIDEVAVFDDVLSEAQVSELYQTRRPDIKIIQWLD